jgi:hypothetical protein
MHHRPNGKSSSTMSGVSIAAVAVSLSIKCSSWAVMAKGTIMLPRLITELPLGMYVSKTLFISPKTIL